MSEIVVEHNLLDCYPFCGDTCHRSLYWSEDHVASWLSLSAAPEYPDSECRADPVSGMYEELIKEAMAAEPPTEVAFLSFGCGDGRVDLDLVKLLSKHTKMAGYIPVDISKHLLETSVSRLSRVTEVPFGIVADIERGLDCVFRHVRSYLGVPLFLSMLGNTLCSLDMGMAPFLLDLKRMLLPNEIIFFSVSQGPYDVSAGQLMAERLRTLCAKILSTDRKKEYSEGDFAMSVTVESGIPDRYCVTCYDPTDGSRLLQVRGVDEGFKNYVAEAISAQPIGEKRLERVAGMGFGIGCYLFVKN